MEQQHYFPPLHGAVDCEKCEVRDCWCRGKFQRNRRDMPHTSGRCPRLPDLCGFVEKEERELYKATFMLVHAEYGVGGLHLTLTIPGHKRNRKVYQSKEDILRHMKSLRTDYCILRCSMEGFTV